MGPSEPLHAVQKNDLAGEGLVIAKQVDARLGEIEVDPEQHRRHADVERERMANESARQVILRRSAP